MSDPFATVSLALRSPPYTDRAVAVLVEAAPCQHSVLWMKCSDTSTRITHEELEQLLRGYGWTPYFVEGHEPALMHEAMATTVDTAIEAIKKIQEDAHVHGNLARPRWPMIVLNSPKGWTGPKMVDGLSDTRNELNCLSGSDSRCSQNRRRSRHLPYS